MTTSRKTCLLTWLNLRREKLDAVLSEMADNVVFLEQATPTPGTFAQVSVKATALAKTFAPGYGAARHYMAKISVLTELARATKNFPWPLVECPSPQRLLSSEELGMPRQLTPQHGSGFCQRRYVIFDCRSAEPILLWGGESSGGCGPRLRATALRTPDGP